jgi:CYTH domain-containing protein
MIEREKRWKIKSEIPTENIKDKFTITQIYVDSKNPTIRIRKITRENSEEFYHTVKYQLSQINEREEIEQKISKERYERIFKVIDKKPVIKERIIIDIGNDLIAEVDKFKDVNEIIVEVEFPDVETMKNFVKPDWFGDEIKTNKSFSYEVFTKINNINISIWNQVII